MIVLFFLFTLLASPVAFRTIRGVLGTWVSSAEGLPTFAGIFLHAFVFIFVLKFLTYHPGMRSNFEIMYDPSVSRATDYGMHLASKGPDDMNKF
jgi:hypothetical protein